MNFDPRTYIAVIGDMLYAIKTISADPAAWPVPITWKVPLPLAARNDTDLAQRPFVGSWSAADMANLQPTTQVMDPAVGFASSTERRGGPPRSRKTARS